MTSIRTEESLEESAPERWQYVIYLEDGRRVVLTQEEWERLHRAWPEDQG